MNSIISKRIINADIDTIWSHIEDVTLIENWHPGVDNTEQLSVNKIGVGAIRRCNFYDGSEAVEEIISVTDNYQIKINIREFKAPMSRFISTWQLVKTKQGKTEITVVTEYKMKFGLVGRIMDKLFIRHKMPKLFDKVLAGLDHHVITGQRIEKGFNDTTMATSQ